MAWFWPRSPKHLDNITLGLLLTPASIPEGTERRCEDPRPKRESG
ncbi:hypothetical protein [Acetomicrobium hydrogeniformans]|nr:hypothetical protein [Acetomicrobium hydrogeniformans]